MLNQFPIFGKSIQKLARNPLGIIALFILLIYGIAGTVLSLSLEHLSMFQKNVLIWFLVGFPVVVLITFFRLVTKHHTKLYAPLDYHDSEGFFRSISKFGKQEINKSSSDEEIKKLTEENNEKIKELSDSYTKEANNHKKIKIAHSIAHHLQSIVFFIESRIQSTSVINHIYARIYPIINPKFININVLDTINRKSLSLTNELYEVIKSVFETSLEIDDNPDDSVTKLKTLRNKMDSISETVGKNHSKLLDYGETTGIKDFIDLTSKK